MQAVRASKLGLLSYDYTRIYLTAKLREKIKMPKLGTKNVLFGYFRAKSLKSYCHIEISTLKFVKNKSLTHIMNFGIGSAFSKGLGSAFSEGLRQGPGPLYKLCICLFGRSTEQPLIKFEL